MLIPFAILSAALLVCAAVIQWAIAILFESSFRRQTSALGPSDEPQSRQNAQQKEPRVAVLMSVRGADPSLEHSINGVLNQTHTNYEVHVVVDHPDDDAWPLLKDLAAKHANGDRLKLQLMKEPSLTCSLKCHCLVQAASSVDDSIDYIALLDADVTPHSTWLRALTVPLTDESIGGVTGTQWFEPDSDATFGSWWRSTWNGGAMIPTIYFANPWAGSFAMRKADLLRSGLLAAWSHSIVDDGPIQEYLGSIGMKVVFAPSLIMINRENCGPRYVLRWTTRMLTWSRLHEPSFYLSQIHAAFSNLVLTANVAVIFAGGILASCGIIPISSVDFWGPITISLVALIIAGVLCVAAYASGRRCVEHSCSLRGDPIDSMDWKTRWSVFWSAAPAHWAYGISCWRASWANRVSWRGIDYHIDGKNKIERLNYAPFSRQVSDEQHSI